MSWIDTNEYDVNDICPICHDEYGTTKAIYRTECRHNFHNNCLNKYCESQQGQIVCPICRADIGDSCMNVWAFKNSALENADGSPLFNGNQHVLDIYNSQPDIQGGRRPKRKTRKSIHHKRKTKKHHNKKSKKHHNRKTRK